VKKILAVATALLAAGLVAATLSAAAGSPSVLADQPDDPAPTPITTEVTPVVVPVDPVEQVVTPVMAEAEQEITTVEQGAAGENSSSSLFTRVRGGLIGAGIAAGALAVIAGLIAAARVGLRRLRE
jgi:hypothetical protein